MVGPVKISYVNNSGYSIPPYGVVELSGDMQLLGNGERVIPATRPSGKGPYAIDDGKGATSTDSGKYGTAIIPYDNLAWVAWDGTDPGEAWKDQVGPIRNTFTVGNKGSGYLYAGAKDATSNRLLVVQSTPKNVRMVVIQRNGIGGEKENVAITRSTDSYFSAAVIDDDSAGDVQDLQDPKKNTIVQVSRRFITTVLFTGQEFVGSTSLTSFSQQGNANTESDVIASPGFTQFQATFRTGVSWTCEVDYRTVFSNSGAANASRCRVMATNRTGQTLVDGQRVIVQLDPVYGWAIVEFFCADGYLNPGGGNSGIDGTGGGFPLP